MAYRDQANDPRVAEVRRSQLAIELIAVRAIAKAFRKELEIATGQVNETSARLERERNGPRWRYFAGFWALFWRPDPEAIEREVLELGAARKAYTVAQHLVALADRRERAIAESVANAPPPDTSAVDATVRARADAECLSAALVLVRELRASVREASTLATEAHRDEMTAALTGRVKVAPVLPRADQEVQYARCRVELARASLTPLGDTAAPWIQRLIETSAMLQRAGTGPSQEWRDEIAAVRTRIDELVESITHSAPG